MSSQVLPQRAQYQASTSRIFKEIITSSPKIISTLRFVGKCDCYLITPLSPCSCSKKHKLWYAGIWWWHTVTCCACNENSHDYFEVIASTTAATCFET